MLSFSGRTAGFQQVAAMTKLFSISASGRRKFYRGIRMPL